MNSGQPIDRTQDDLAERVSVLEHNMHSLDKRMAVVGVRLRHIHKAVSRLERIFSPGAMLGYLALLCTCVTVAVRLISMLR